MAAVHYTGTGLPGQATASAFHAGEPPAQRAHIFSDAGLTLEQKNPFVAENGVYDFWADDTLGVVYVVVGVDAPIFEDVALIRGGDEYLAPEWGRFPRQQYNPTNVTTLRDGDFSTLVAADVRSILGTLIQDLKDLGVLK